MTFCKTLAGTRSIIALIMRVGEGVLATEHAAGKFLSGKAHADSPTHPNSPHGYDRRPCHRLYPTSRYCSIPYRGGETLEPADPSLPTVPSCSSAEDSPTATTTGGEWTSAREVRDLSASGSSGKTAKVSAVPSLEKPPLLPLKKDNAPALPSFLLNESTLVTVGEDNSDTNETFRVG